MNLKINGYCFIYKIENSKNNKCYIGSTSNISSRWGYHIKRLSNLSHNKSFQDDYNKYGINCFSFSVLESNILPSDKTAREQYWFNLFNCEYNATEKIYSDYQNKNTILKVLELISSGQNYRTIAQITKVSIGTISNIKKKYSLVGCG